jgi:hypothetical protein
LQAGELPWDKSFFRNNLGWVSSTSQDANSQRKTMRSDILNVKMTSEAWKTGANAVMERREP